MGHRTAAAHEPCGAAPVSLFVVQSFDICPGFHVSISRQPLRSTLPCTWEQAAAELEALPRMIFEPDGSWIWSGGVGAERWQIDGHLFRFRRSPASRRTARRMSTCRFRSTARLFRLARDGAACLSRSWKERDLARSSFAVLSRGARRMVPEILRLRFRRLRRVKEKRTRMKRRERRAPARPAAATKLMNSRKPLGKLDRSVDFSQRHGDTEKDEMESCDELRLCVSVPP